MVFLFLCRFLLFLPCTWEKKQKRHQTHPTCLVLGQHASLEELRFLATKKAIYPVLNRDFCIPKCFLGMLSVELNETQISNLGVLNLKCINKHISLTFNIFCPKGILTSQLEVTVAHRKPTKIAKALLNTYSLQQTTITWHTLRLPIHSTFYTSFFGVVRPHGNVFLETPTERWFHSRSRGWPQRSLQPTTSAGTSPCKCSWHELQRP